jgi:aryl-alcohol dehydrogenase-like predicted oxidoreductase
MLGLGTRGIKRAGRHKRVIGARPAGIIAGATQPEQIEATVKATGWTLSAEETAEIDHRGVTAAAQARPASAAASAGNRPITAAISAWL